MNEQIPKQPKSHGKAGNSATWHSTASFAPQLVLHEAQTLGMPI